MDKESEKMWKQIQNKLLDIKSLSIDRYEALLDKYEQLQAENEKLKNQYSFSTILKIDELEQENEQLKARLRPLEDSYFKGLSSIQITELAKKSIRITAENRKLEYALREIREIVETCLKFHKCEKCKFYKECQYDLEEYILTKINEVIGAE